MTTNLDLTKVGNINIAGLARVISDDWKKPYFGAVPYLDAMATMHSVTDFYGFDSGPSIIHYFLANASTWRGETARAVKAELRRRVK